MSPDRSAVAIQTDRHDARQSFALGVIGDAALSAEFAAIKDAGAFIDESVRQARARGIALSAADLRHVSEPDPLGIARWADAPLSGSALPPRDWLPVAVTPTPNEIVVDWARFGPEPLREPFFEDSLRRALSQPFNRAFRYRTGLHDLVAQHQTTESLTPSGFIFHMSRCGSTLAAQMLAALPDSIVISEAAPIDAIVQLARGHSGDDAIRVLQAMIAAFGRKRGGKERRYVIKLDCWHTLALPLFRRAFPDVPWVFLYRDPVEVLVSQMRQRGMQMVPQFLPPSVYGIAPGDFLLDENYCARVLAAVCQAVIDHHDLSRQHVSGQDLSGGLFLNYRRLPDAVYSTILPHFGISCSEAERDKMRLAAQQNAKSPSFPFAGDSDEKQRAAAPALRRAAEQHLGAIYRRLEAMMQAASVKQGAVS